MSVSGPAVFDTSVVGGVVDRDVVYHQTVRLILVQYCESWAKSKLSKSVITKVNVVSIRVQRVQTRPVNIFTQFCGTRKRDRLSDLRRSIIEAILRL